MPPRIQPSSAHVSEPSGSTLEAFVGRQIRFRRMLMGFTQAQVATLLGVSFQHIHQFERGYHLNASRLYALSRALSVPVGMLFPSTSSALSPPDPDVVRNPLDLSLKDDGREQPEILIIVNAFQRLRSPESRKKILAWIDGLSQDPSLPAPSLSKDSGSMNG